MTDETFPPDARAGIARFQLQMTLAALRPLDRVLALVPDDRIAEEVVAGQMPVGTLIGHTYQAVATLVRGSRLGHLDEADMEGIPDPEGVTERQVLMELAAVARAEVTAALDSVTPETADALVDFFFGFSATGLQATSIAYSELLHHRGQAVTFLRVMGIEPPDIYEGAG
ncbi:MAG: DinB family protein [Gemmatimonadota bacterium]|nr:DinB family protein [Gemmatimonadota bacterium]